MSRSAVQKITIGFGIIYLLAGILGFIPGFTRFTDNPTGSVPGEGLLLGILAVNVIHNIAHLAIGAILIWGGLSAARVVGVNKVMAGVFLVLVVASVIAPIVEGVNLNLADTILHLASALLTAFLGFGTARQVSRA